MNKWLEILGAAFTVIFAAAMAFVSDSSTDRLLSLQLMMLAVIALRLRR